MGEAGAVATYRDIHTLAEMLKYNMKDFGSGREVIVEGNTIIIRIEGTTDIYTGKEIENHEYRLQFNSEELFGSYYISAGEYTNIMGQYSALRIKEGFLGSVQMQELEEQAIRMMENCYTKEALESMSREEYNELLQSCMISADLSGLVYAGFETEHVRAVESFNELKDTFISTFGMVVLAASMMLPPTAPLTIALFGADATLAVGDGILRISQGDELAGTIEAFAGALALGEFAYIVKTTRGASKVTYSTVPNGNGGIDEVEETIEVITKDLDELVPDTPLKEIDNISMDNHHKPVKVISGDKGSLNTNNYSGEEWCRYFRKTYGSDNVRWENATPSQLARSWQGDGKYPGVDKYTDVTVKKGTILYRGEPNGTEYFTTIDAIEKSGRNATNVFEGLQVEKHPIHGYRREMQGYVFNDDIASAYGITYANPQFGKGGLPQYYVPYAKDLIDKGILTPIDNIKLYN